MSYDDDLFGTKASIEADAKKLARKVHPSTSKEAARQLVASGQLGALQDHALELLRRWPDATAAELASFDAAPDSRRVPRRLRELVRLGKAIVSGKRRCTVTGRTAQTWRACS
jgi:hypothetical protein